MEQEVLLTSIPVGKIEEIISRAVQESFNQMFGAQPPENPDELISRRDAAQMLGISLPTLREYTTREIIPGYRIGTRVRYKKGEILNCLQKVRAAKYRAA